MYMPLKDAYNRDLMPSAGAPVHASAFNPNNQLTGPFFQMNGNVQQQQPPTFYNPYSLDSYQKPSSAGCGSCGDSAPRTGLEQAGMGHGGGVYGGGRQMGPQLSHRAQVALQTNNLVVAQLKRNILKIAEELGIAPNWHDLSPDGGALWKYDQMIKGNSLYCKVFNRVEVCADRIAKTKPIPYVACVTTTTKVKLTPHLVKELVDRFPMVSYCPVSHTLQITMDSLEHNLAILALICGVQQNKIGLWRIRFYDLIKKYLQLTTPGHRRYRSGAKWGLVSFIRR